MLDQISYWVDIASAVFDGLLLARVLQLRLPRTYLFITLFCLVGLFYDLVQLWFGVHSSESERIALYSRFLYALLYPLAAWDAVEEMKGPILQVRRVLVGRLVTGLLLASIFGFIVGLLFTSDDNNAAFATTAALALVLWAGSCTSSLGFLWSLQKATKAQHLVRPHNTAVWMSFFQLVLLAEIASCFGSIAMTMANATVQDAVNIVLTVYIMGVTAWCIIRLRRVPSDVPSEASSSAS